MKENRIAEVYARLFFRVCLESKEEKRGYEDVRYLWSLCEKKEWMAFLESPLYKKRTKRSVLGKLLSCHLWSTTWAFVGLLADRERLGYLKTILAFFMRQYRAYERVGIACITVAHSLTREAKEELAGCVKRLMGWQEVKMMVKIDGDIMGGYILDLDNKRLDLSLRSRLGALERFWQSNGTKQGGLIGSMG